MKLKIWLILLSLSVSLAAKAQTNFLWSSATVSNHVRTNIVNLSNNLSTVSTANLSNANYNASNYFFTASNMVWGLTNAKVTTNFAVLTPGSNVNWLRITNGIVTGITNAAP